MYIYFLSLHPFCMMMMMVMIITSLLHDDDNRDDDAKLMMMNQERNDITYHQHLPSFSALTFHSMHVTTGNNHQFKQITIIQLTISLRLTQTLLISAIFSLMAAASSGFSSSRFSASPCNASSWKPEVTKHGVRSY